MTNRTSWTEKTTHLSKKAQAKEPRPKMVEKAREKEVTTVVMKVKQKKKNGKGAKEEAGQRKRIKEVERRVGTQEEIGTKHGNITIRAKTMTMQIGKIGGAIKTSMTVGDYMDPTAIVKKREWRNGYETTVSKET